MFDDTLPLHTVPWRCCESEFNLYHDNQLILDVGSNASRSEYLRDVSSSYS